MSAGKMSWETEAEWWPSDRAWWMIALDTNWAEDDEIQQEIGPEYLMYEDMFAFGAETPFKGFHSVKNTFPRNRIP